MEYERTPPNVANWMEYWQKRAEKAEAENAALRKRIAELEDVHQSIRNWIHAYPLDVFPEPDFKLVRDLLASGGITLDAVSASNMRHVLTGIEKILDGKEE